MKTQRRQELKANELSIYLMEMREYVRQHVSTIAIVAVGAVLLVAAVAYRGHTVSQSREQGWQAYRDAVLAAFTPAPDNPAWQDEAMDQLEAIIDAAPDPIVVSETRWQLAQFCLRQFLEGGDNDKRARLLEQAEQQCKTILNGPRPSTTMRGAALNGLIAVEENRYVLDGEPAHRENARDYLEQLRDGIEFLGTVFQADALSRLNDFEKRWKPLVLAEAPAPAAAETAGKDEQQIHPAADDESSPSETAPSADAAGKTNEPQTADEPHKKDPAVDPERP